LTNLIGGNVALSLLQNREETRLEIFGCQRVRQLQRTSGILDDLHGFQTGNFVKKPAAAREHQHRVPLHFQQAQHGGLFRFVQFAHRVLGKKFRACFRRAVQNDRNILVPCQPRIFQKLFPPRFKNRCQLVAQPVERLAQRRAPLLIPAAMTAGVTTAVALPTFDAMRTAPRAALMNLRLVRWRMRFQIFAVDRQLHVLAFFNLIQGKRQRHVAKLKMVAVGFAVRGDVNQLVAVTAAIKRPHQTRGKFFAVRQKFFKCDGLRDRRVVKENRHGPARGQLHLIRH